MHFFVVSYEFIFSPFSGNGILARSLVNSLLEHGHFVLVWCARPTVPSSSQDDSLMQEVFPRHDGRLQIISTVVEASKWKCLDENSAWETFVYSKSSEATQAELLSIGEKTTNPIVPVVIDWHGSHAYQTLPFSDKLSPLIYMNFRVYSAGIADEKRHAWLDQMELKALQAADKVVALSQHDRELLEEMNNQDGICKEFKVFYPPLRKDIHQLGTLPSSSPHLPLPKSVPEGKQFVTCVVRLSPEKETQRFLPFLESIRDLMTESKGWIPLLAGSPSDKAYAKVVRDQLKEKFPESIDLVDTFLSPNELCAIFQRTVINFHPCSYDAYGMTIVEAAAMGVPSVIANNRQVGSSHLIGTDASVPMDMASLPVGTNEISKVDSVQNLRTILQDEVQIRALGECARERALAWNEAAYGSSLVQLASGTTKPKAK